ESVRTTGVFAGDAQRALRAARNTSVTPVTDGGHGEALVQACSHVVGVGGDATGHIVLHAQLDNAGDGSLDFGIVPWQTHVHGQVSGTDEDRTHTRCGHDGFGVLHTLHGLDLHHGQQFAAWVQGPGVGTLDVVVHTPVPGGNAWRGTAYAGGIGDVRAARLRIAHGCHGAPGLFCGLDVGEHDAEGTQVQDLLDQPLRVVAAVGR